MDSSNKPPAPSRSNAVHDRGVDPRTRYFGRVCPKPGHAVFRGERLVANYECVQCHRDRQHARIRKLKEQQQMLTPLRGRGLSVPTPNRADHDAQVEFNERERQLQRREEELARREARIARQEADLRTPNDTPRPRIDDASLPPPAGSLIFGRARSDAEAKAQAAAIIAAGRQRRGENDDDNAMDLETAQQVLDEFETLSNPTTAQVARLAIAAGIVRRGGR